MLHGRYQLGEYLPLVCLCVQPGRIPVAPDEAPTAVIVGSSGQVFGRQLPPADPNVQPALFGQQIFLGSGFAVGHFVVMYHWRIGGVPYGSKAAFEITAGGSVDGTVISMYPYLKPQAKYLVQQLDSGRLVVGKNPRF